MTPDRQPRESRTRCAATLVAVAILVVTSVSSTLASGAREKVIHNFTASDGSVLGYSSLIADKAGNLYGTLEFSDTPDRCCGSVFELSPPTTPGGDWTETILYKFGHFVYEGRQPSGPLVFDKSGNLYGVTRSGGLDSSGVVFELFPPPIPGGVWREIILFTFTAPSPGVAPSGRLVIDSAGNLYGTTQYGGTNPQGVCYCGIAYELSPNIAHGGEWVQTVLHTFGDVPTDGAHPRSGLIVDRNGALYGTTWGGGSERQGTIFRLTQENGVWSESILYDFNGKDGSRPYGSLIFDAVGNLYGTTGPNRADNCICGTVYELSPPAVSGNSWNETTLYTFTGGKDGDNPTGGLVFDRAGNLYGTASERGLKNSLTSNNGTVFELSPPAVSGEVWTETTLHEFGGLPYGDGTQPLAGLTLVKGKFYGTTNLGGEGSNGTVFSLTIVP